ncbi:MAG: hypothetical protein RQ753_00390 [Desulfurivibrionaceae bacterium]|nr:hypothetical protein [Desulfurivibrionaceae bacterium]
MDTIEIRYIFKFSDGRREQIDLRLDPHTLDVVNRSPENPPEWVGIDYCRCPHCADAGLVTPYCPVALSLVDVVKRFGNVTSHEPVDLQVVSAGRTISQHTVAQKAISSLLGLLISTSGCPFTDFFKPMARFHLPLSSEEETVFRASGMYLLAQYFRKREGQSEDCELRGLARIYDDLHRLNVSIARRLRHATKEDSSLNAMTVLDIFTHTFQCVIEEELAELRQPFAPYFSGSYQKLLDDL